MSRFFPYFGTALALLFIFLAILSGNASAPIPTAVSESDRPASSTLSVVPTDMSVPNENIVSTSSVVSADSGTTTVVAEAPALPAPEKKAKQPPVKVVTPPAPVATSTPPASAPVSQPAPLASSGNVGLDAAATTLRGALVNIICYAPIGSSIRSISGSGIFIDPKGIILTNAHVAQYFLLADKGVSCTVRTGSPAVDQYKAALVYISPAWIHANATVLSQTAPIGTGEYDFALVAVTKSATTAALPLSFPYIPLAMVPPNQGTPIVIASFGAQFLTYAQIQSALSPILVFGSIKDVFTFGTNTIDVLSLGGSAAAQEGSSGGGLADASGTLVGTITTSTIEGSTDTRVLSAVTASYIRSEYAREMNGDSIDVLLSTPTATSIADFAPQIPLLESIVTANLQ